MNPPKPQEFNLDVLAPNGLRRGRTTGTCATAAVKAALFLLLLGTRKKSVHVTLPEAAHYLYTDWTGTYYLVVPIEKVTWLDEQNVRAEVLKDAGDDADNTHGATIFAEICKNDINQIRFYAGHGVGTVTMPGIRLPVGEPAINPVPRQMMQRAVAEALTENDQEDSNTGFDLTIGCENGEILAQKTFNPRLGILGGISILGTSGIVEPMSLASWIAAIEVYVRVALADDAKAVAYLPGKIARSYIKTVLKLPTHRVVEVANFLGDALNFTQKVLNEEQGHLEVLWLAGHPGKLAKVLGGVWDTHSSKSSMAMNNVAQVAIELGFTQGLVQEIQLANTVEAVIQRLSKEPEAQMLWIEIEQRIAALAHQRIPSVRRVETRLFDLHGNALGIDA
ncbi:MAG: cobalt-precorrin-5B (C(1))-methyltransferase CbiD [Granulosicoccaceae bacterium]